MSEKYSVPLGERYTLTILQMAEYTGIGVKRLRQIVAENPTADYLLYCGVKVFFKRRKFEKYLDETSSI